MKWLRDFQQPEKVAFETTLQTSSHKNKTWKAKEGGHSIPKKVKRKNVLQGNSQLI